MYTVQPRAQQIELASAILELFSKKNLQMLCIEVETGICQKDFITQAGDSRTCHVFI